jgi:5,5'-dehydrodivanillate O-demethylase
VAATRAAVTNGTERETPNPDWTDYVHTGPSTLAGRYLRLFWQPICLAEELPKGRAKPLKIMSEEFTLYRGEDGTPHAIAFRCAHRGTQLSTGWVEGDNLRCFYHGWMYGPDGQCVDQPAEPEPFCQRIKIRSYPVEEYLGLIFIYMGEGASPPLRRFPMLEDGIVEPRGDVIWPCNFFNRLDNDPVHVSFIHRWVPWPRPYRGVPTHIDAEETDYGMVEYVHRPGGGVSESYRMMPNISIFGGGPPRGYDEGWQSTLSWRVPIDDEHFTRFSIMLVGLEGEAAERYLAGRAERQARFDAAPKVTVDELAERVLQGGERLEDMPREYWDRLLLITVQDYVCLIGQGPIAERANERLGHSDTTVILFRNLWMRELRKLAEGKPLKDWTQPVSLIAAFKAGTASGGD